MKFNNIAAYKFVPLNNLEALKAKFLPICHESEIKGTILLSPEGVNIMLSGRNEAIKVIKNELIAIPELADLWFKESASESCAFKQLFIKIKPEIITLRNPSINPLQKTGEYLEPAEFKQWLDENRDVVVIDARNDFEVGYGTFVTALNLKLGKFTDFPAAIDKLDESLKDKPVVTFCTGGVRCEKATAVMLKKGFSKVYQIKGGILNYFEQCGDAHYQGSCFVFDDREALSSNLLKSS